MVTIWSFLRGDDMLYYASSFILIADSVCGVRCVPPMRSIVPSPPMTAWPHCASRGTLAAACVARGGSANCQCKATPFGSGIVFPFRHIHDCAAARDVVLNLPRNRRNAGVPWPARYFRVTATTCAIEDRAHLRRHLGVSRERLFRRGTASRVG